MNFFDGPLKFLLRVYCILDPCFKKMYFDDPTAYSNAISKLNDIMKNSFQSEVSTVEFDSDSSDKTVEDFSLWRDHEKLEHQNWKLKKMEESLCD